MPKHCYGCKYLVDQANAGGGVYKCTRWLGIVRGGWERWTGKRNEPTPLFEEDCYEGKDVLRG